ncbi:zinc finger MYM-type protein 6 [Trichonephila clavipes]|nr:zinc finger MYM-type protein 6 [Trichonephila clavipes]
MPKSASDIIKRIPLSNNTAQRHIDEMSQDFESCLCYCFQTTHFSLQLKESTLPGNESLFLVCVCFIMDQEHQEEMLFARILTTDSKDESIFNVLKEYFIENSIPLSNIISVAIDGAPAMVGHYRGFIGHLKQNVLGVLAIHCVIHQQHLVAKNLNGRLHESLQFVINTIKTESEATR